VKSVVGGSKIRRQAKEHHEEQHDLIGKEQVEPFLRNKQRELAREESAAVFLHRVQ
jgi:hypothetical protein